MWQIDFSNEYFMYDYNKLIPNFSVFINAKPMKNFLPTFNFIGRNFHIEILEYCDLFLNESFV